MPLSNIDLLESIKKALESGFNQKFDELKSEINELRSTNEKLIKINAELITYITQNEHLRASIPKDTGDIVAPPLENHDDAFSYKPCEVITENIEHSEDKIYIDVLVLSDSIFRHVGGDSPKDPSVKGPIYSHLDLGNTTVFKCVISGARVERLWEEAVALNRTHCFSEIIVNVGANYIPSPQSRNSFWFFPPPSAVGLEIKSFLDAIADLFDTDVTFSAIPPRMDMKSFRVISRINSDIHSHCRINNYGVLRCPAFALRTNGRLDSQLFSRRAGVHLAGPGIRALGSTLRAHIISGFAKDHLIF